MVFSFHSFLVELLLQRNDAPHESKEGLGNENALYCYEFVNIVTKICIYYLFLNYNISDARGIFIFGEKSRDFS